MSILDVFYILFESKTDGVRDGAKEAGKHVDEFERHVKETDRSTKALGLSFMEIGKTIGELAVGYLGISSAFDLTSNTIQFNAELDKMSKLTGISVHQLETLRNAVNKFGYDGNKVLGNYMEIYSQMVAQGNGSQFLARFQNDLTKVQALMAEALKNPDKNQGLIEAGRIGEQWHIPVELRPFLMQPTAKVEQLMAQAAAHSKANQESGEDARETLRKLEEAKQEFEGLANRVELSVLPKINEFLKEFIDEIDDLTKIYERVKGEKNTWATAAIPKDENGQPPGLLGTAKLFGLGALAVAGQMPRDLMQEYGQKLPDEFVQTAAASMSAADNSPFNGRRTESLLTNSGDQSVNITGLNITVNAPNSDPEVIAETFKNIFNGTIANFTDGFFLR